MRTDGRFGVAGLGDLSSWLRLGFPPIQVSEGRLFTGTGESEHHVFGARLVVEGFDGALVDEVELGVSAGDDVGVAAGLQGAHVCRAG